MDKVIWMLWFQGWDNAPEANKICLETWKYYNPDWIVCGLDENTLGKYIDVSLIPSRLNRDMTAQSDIIRLMLLEKYGGVWADSTVFCNKPLDDWLPEGPFMFTKPNKFLHIASWFISVPKESYMMREWLKSSLDYWKVRRTVKNYFWLHYRFKYLLSNDKKFREEWDCVEKINCSYNLRPHGKGPHYFCPYKSWTKRPITQEDWNRVHSQVDPMYKLTNKYTLHKKSAIQSLLYDFKNKYMK